MKTKQILRESLLRGTAICRGIAIGKPFSFSFLEEDVPRRKIKPSEVEGEIDRYESAIKKSNYDLKILQDRLLKEKVLDGAAILEAQQQMLVDPMLTDAIVVSVRDLRTNVEAVFYDIISAYQQKFDTLTDPFFRERARDIRDIARRVLGYLLGTMRISFSDLPKNSIVIARELTPSDVAEANKTNVAAFVTESDGETSHAAIVAKAKGITFVTSIDFAKMESELDGEVVVDGRNGTVILHPEKKTLEKFRSLQKQMEDQYTKLQSSNGYAAETFDGFEVALSANIDVLHDFDSIHKFGASGVGLFRSECVFLTHETFPEEEEQNVIYRQIVEKMEGLPVVIRTFDVGGDKFITSQNQLEDNPFLGCRAIRFLLRERDLFRAQLRAILRASNYGNVRILFPMITALSELISAKEVVEEAKDDLRKEGVPFAEQVPIGCMIEVPSAAIVADLLAKECDFFSIGTNDLVQYSLAVDRGNQEVSGMYTPTDPSVVRLIKLVVGEANHQGIPVTVCGEVAADPRFTPLLLGLGVQELSVASRYLPIIKNAVRHTSLVEAHALASRVLSLTTAASIEELITAEYHRKFPGDIWL